MHSCHMHTWSERDAWYVQDGITMPEGLWADGGKLQRDLATITQRIRLMGFNAVRLPFSMKDLFNLSPKYVCCATACATAHACVVALPAGSHAGCAALPVQRLIVTCAAVASCVRAHIRCRFLWCLTGRAQRNAKS